MSEGIHYQFGIPEGLREEAAQLYDEAFGAKFAPAVRNQEKRQGLLADSLRLPFAVAAILDGRLIGLAGFQTWEGALTGGMNWGTLSRQLGLLRGAWAAMALSLYERKPEEGELLMDGIAVKAEMRGKGVGTQLLNKLKQYARELSYQRIRLDVIDTNPAARRLYERLGFTAAGREEFGYLRWLLGFGGTTRMVFELE